MSKPTYKELGKRVKELDKVIIEQKMKCDELEKNLIGWRETFDSISDIVTLISPSHEFVKINKNGCLALGKPEEELRGKKCYEIVHNTDKPIEDCPCAKTLKSKKAEVG